MLKAFWARDTLWRSSADVSWEKRSEESRADTGREDGIIDDNMVKIDDGSKIRSRLE